MSIRQNERLVLILGWGPRRWRGTDSLRSLDKARDGEPVEPLEGESRLQRDRLVKWKEETFCDPINSWLQGSFSLVSMEES